MKVQEDIMIQKDVMILERVKTVVLLNEVFPVEREVRLGRSNHPKAYDITHYTQTQRIIEC